MERNMKVSIQLMLDMLFVVGSILLAYYFRFNMDVPEGYFEQGTLYAVISVCVCLGTMYMFRLYKRLWRYASVGEMITIWKAVTLGCAVSFILTDFVIGSRVPLSVAITSYETMFIGMGGVRFGWRMIRRSYKGHQLGQNRALIIGAGDCGLLVASKLLENANAKLFPVAFIDDDVVKHGQTIKGLPVVGGRHDMERIVQELRIDEIIVALPSVSRKEIAQIISICKGLKKKLNIIPRIDDLIHGEMSIPIMRNVEVEDLLGREPVLTDLKEIASYLNNKTVLVTGAGGSIGSEICRQVSKYNPKCLILLGHGENSIFQIERELVKGGPTFPITSIIADTQDAGRMEQVFHEYKPEVVFHAAAHKHVPLMEKNPSEAIKNNVFGTRNVANCAHQFGSERFVLISTDKAVNPTSVMGVTKRIAEMYIQCLNQRSKTLFTAVRFGNVLGSRGSVIPSFREQIAAGGPVTVTHPEMIRYFMTIPEATSLVIQAGTYAHGGETFILDMGSPVKIVDLAKDLIRLSGFEPYKEIDIQYTGIRPGEKLYEELLTNEEGLSATKHNRIFIGRAIQLNEAEMEFAIKKLEKAVEEKPEAIRRLLQHIVPTYQYRSKEGVGL
ncbi:polysaccharide biosynthesis protein [Paenibacillus sp. KN14-4R]|uniref:polysaccharide biosynthesis protein n=1 Tax=Paenibacillus sp. KN14-4R TaxID=3445773 RepID=UPI003FA08079